MPRHRDPDETNLMAKIMPKAASPTSLTAFQLSRWVRDAEPGAFIQYHEGLLAADVEVSAVSTAGERKHLLAVARFARRASDQRLVHLVQRRLGSGRFAYFAVKCTPAAGSETS